MLFERSVCTLEAPKPSPLTDHSRHGPVFLIHTPSHAPQHHYEDRNFREKRIQCCDDLEELIQSLGSLNLERDYWMRLTERVKSLDPFERYEGTRQFRMMLSVSGEIPIQDVIDTGIVPYLVEFTGFESDPNLQFEAAWALTNVASGTCQQTEVFG